MYSDGKSHEERYQQYPSVCIWRIRLLVPSGHRPDYQGGEKRRHRIDLTLDCGEPECIREAVCQCSDGAAAADQYRLAQTPLSVLSRFPFEPLGEENDGEIEKEDGQCGTERTHGIDCNGCMRSVRKHCEESRNELEYRVSWRVTYFELI